MKRITFSLFVGLLLLMPSLVSADTVVGDSILLGEFVFTESNDFVAKNVPNGLSVSDLIPGKEVYDTKKGIEVGRDGNALKLLGWKPAYNIAEGKYIAATITATDPANKFEFVAIEIKMTGNIDGLQLKQGPSITALINKAIGIKIENDTEFPAIRTLRVGANPEMLIGPQSELCIALAMSSRDKLTTAADFPFHNYAKITNVKLWGKYAAPTGIEDIQTGALIVSGKTIFMNGFDAKSISIFDAAGVMVKQTEVSGASAQITVPNAGLYCVRFESENGVATRKVLVQ